MNFNKHLELRGLHAVFSPSQSSWLRYNKEKIADKLLTLDATAIGTELHAFAETQIQLRVRYRSLQDMNHSLMTYIYQKYKDEKKNELTDFGKRMLSSIGRLSKETLSTVQKHINDAVGYRMEPEQPLYYTDYIFGTADAISYRDGVLRIHDLKTGKSPVHMEQLVTYAALFFLEYHLFPEKTETHLRIYQNDDVVEYDPPPEEIRHVMDAINYVKEMSSNILSNTF